MKTWTLWLKFFKIIWLIINLKNVCFEKHPWQFTRAVLHCLDFQLSDNSEIYLILTRWVFITLYYSGLLLMTADHFLLIISLFNPDNSWFLFITSYYWWSLLITNITFNSDNSILVTIDHYLLLILLFNPENSWLLLITSYYCWALLITNITF